MSEPKRVELTEAEKGVLWTWWSADFPAPSVLCETVANIVAAREAAARREALLEAVAAVVDAAPSRGAELDPRTGQEDPGMSAYVEGFHNAHAAVAALGGRGEGSYCDAQEWLSDRAVALAALAEPERDEEGS